MQTEIIKALIGSAGGSDKLYVDDVFSTYLFNGNSGTQTITNGIDFAGEGGMVWCKTRGSGSHFEIADTERGTTNPRVLRSNETDAEVNGDVGNGFTSSGFSLGFESGDVNTSPRAGVSWSFRKAPGFFDVVTYTGNGSARTIAHSLGSVPGMIFVKRTSAARQWCVWHRNLTDNGRYLILNSNFTQQGYSGNTDRWNNQNPTATHLNIGTNDDVNENGASYVAYVFAHDEQSYGENEDQSIIKCGSYTGNGSESNGTVVNLGWEPQWLLVKRLTGQEHWGIVDVMRGWVADGQANILQPNRINAEDSGANSALPTSTGFQLHTTNAEWNGNTETYIYMAIRRPDGHVGKPIEAGTDVFAMDAANPGATPGFTSGFPVDFYLYRDPTASSGWQADWGTYARLIAKKKLFTNKTDAEGSDSSATFAFSDGVQDYDGFGTDFKAWMWKRHAGFDVVAYTGNGSEHHNIYHSLNNTPQMIWIKRRDSAVNWHVFHIGLNGGSAPQDHSINLNLGNPESNNEAFNDYLPNSEQFKVGLNNETNANNGSFLAILFGSVDGVSKVGYYSGSDSSQTITTGFQPRFVIIRRINTTQDWVLLDTLRGWASGNDTRLELNQNAAQNNNTDFGAPISTGFTLEGATAKCNASGGEFIYYAHA
jgi:hypothetical protein